MRYLRSFFALVAVTALLFSGAGLSLAAQGSGSLTVLDWAGFDAEEFWIDFKNANPDVDVTFPRAQAVAVPPNAELSAHYGSPALYDEEAVTLTDALGNDVPVDVRFDEVESMLYAVPSAPLSEGAHELTWPGLRSVSTGGVGLGRKLSFTVVSGEDTAAPSFNGLESIEWDLSREELDRLGVGAGEVKKI